MGYERRGSGHDESNQRIIVATIIEKAGTIIPAFLYPEHVQEFDPKLEMPSRV